MKEVNKYLTEYLNDVLVPKFKESAHKYFGKNFLDDFCWQKIYPNKIKKIKEFQNLKYYVNNSDFSGGYIDENGNLELGKGLFHKNKITGNGVFTFFHEISHCWLNYKFKGNFDYFRNSGNRIQYNVCEGFCDFNSIDIIKRTKIRHTFPDSLKYSEELENAYSYLVNEIKYGGSNEFNYYLNRELSNISTEHLFDYETKKSLWWFNRPIRARVFGLLSCYDNLKQRENFLKNPPKTMQELNNYIPEISN